MNKNLLNTDLTDKVAVVTGAGGVLCGYFSKVLARAGAKVAVLDINEKNAKTVADQISQEGGFAKAYSCNVLDKKGCMRLANQIQSELGPCDILINGAGGNNPKATTDHEFFDLESIDTDTKTFFDLDEEGVRLVFELNFMGTLIPTQAFARQMIGRSGCNILNISSMNAFTPLTKIPAYSGAKAAISNFTQWLAVYFAQSDIRVNALAPGFFSTRQNEGLLWQEDGSPTLRTQKILAATPMKRLGTCHELEGSLLFLLNNEAAGFITGVILPVDGGFSAYSGV